MMKESKKYKKVLLLGSGALKIGEAGEFDYSGSQALKALREEGVSSVLVNPNIATVQTSEGVADRIYFLPVTPFFVEKVIEKERPDGVFLSFGGQTALNCGVELDGAGVFAKYGVEVLGTPVRSIMDTEDRERFVSRLGEIGAKTIESVAASNVEEAFAAAEELGYPIIVRAAYALGGLGSGFCENRQELAATAERAFKYSGQLLIEKSLKGWKEIEFEIVRDRDDNCIAVCDMENFDPLGIHTGESIVVAPSQTISKDAYRMLRELSFRIVRHIGIVGECNVQFALEPDSEDYRVIEVNARLSRSSALASKAAGYPLAYVAAKLGLGYGLREVKSGAAGGTALFEPSLDYIVCKIPRWDLEKFRGVPREIGSSMKSVGEVMAIGQTFEEVLQKGLRMISKGMHGVVANRGTGADDLERALAEPTDRRVLVIEEALAAGCSVERIAELTKIDPWFLRRIEGIHACAQELRDFGAGGSIGELPPGLLMEAKRKGFSDFQIGKLLCPDAASAARRRDEVRARRKALGIVPAVKRIAAFTTAGGPAQNGYLYLTYNGGAGDVAYEDDGRSVVVLGGGTYRIGSSVEFDWCCVGALKTIRGRGWRGVMVNCNPETVSTDYDACDRLYFEELSYERVMDIVEYERPRGVVVSTGGQTPNNLASQLDAAGVPLLGTSAENIDGAENRHRFSAMLDRMGIAQPRWRELSSMEDAKAFARATGFPVLVRPSYVLSGAAMHVCSDEDELERFLGLAASVSREYPVVISEFVEGAKEVEADVVARGGEVLASAVSEHVEFAGTHSGDATIVFPPRDLDPATVAEVRRVAARIARALDVTGPCNIQFLAKDGWIKVIECNLRASRTFPFVSKVSGTDFIELATLAMLGEPAEKSGSAGEDIGYVGVKASQFSFPRLPDADPVHGVEMASTGEVGCLGDDFDEAILKAELSVGMRVPTRGVLLSSGPLDSKAELLPAARSLHEKGHTLYATVGTHRFLLDHQVPSKLVGKPSEEAYPDALELIREGEIDLVVDIPRSFSAGESRDGYRIRRCAVDCNVPLFTDARLAAAFVGAFSKHSVQELAIKSWDEYR